MTQHDTDRSTYEREMDRVATGEVKPEAKDPETERFCLHSRAAQAEAGEGPLS